MLTGAWLFMAKCVIVSVFAVVAMFVVILIIAFIMWLFEGVKWL